MKPRLASSVLVGALIRTAEGQSGFGAVLARGDATAGAVALVIAEKGVARSFLERRLGPDDDYDWEDSGQAVDPESLAALIARRRRADPDLWVVELDVPSVERFVAEMKAVG